MLHLFDKKPIDSQVAEGRESTYRLKRSLRTASLIALGVGATVGSGVFILTGIVSARYAGPAVILSFLLASLVALLAGLCYAEFAAMVPIAGSAYTYAYSSLGELFAWIIGWDLLLEYGCGSAAAAWGWSGYLSSLLADFGLRLPPYLSGSYWDTFVYYNGHWEDLNRVLSSLHTLGVDPASLPHAHGFFNLLGFAVVLVVSTVLVRGIRESAKANTLVVAATIFVLLVFVFLGLVFLMRHPILFSTNLHPFVPAALRPGEFGWYGVVRGAAVLFFAFIGFDAIATTAEETKDPQRDIPRGMMGALAIATVLYILCSGILVSLVNYKYLNVPDPLAVGIDATGLHWGSVLIAIGALGLLISTLLVFLLGGSRVIFSISRDGLLPKWLSGVHPRYKTPFHASISLAVLVSLSAAFLSIDFLTQLFSIGTLLAFSIVCGGVLVLRVRDPRRQRPFRTPWVPVVPVAAIAMMAFMAYSLPGITRIRLVAWLFAGLVIYLAYGSKHSQMRRSDDSAHDDSTWRPSQERMQGRARIAGFLNQLITVFMIVVGIAAVLAIVSAFLPSVNQSFDKIAAPLSILAICAGIAYAVVPSLMALWSQSASEQEEKEVDVLELIESLQREPNGTENKTRRS